MFLLSVPPPLIASLLSFATYVSALSLLPPSSSLRPLLFLLMLVYIAIAIAPPWPTKFSNPINANIFGCNTFTLALQYGDQVLLGRWSYESQGPTNGKGGQNPALGNSSTKDHDRKRKPAERVSSEKVEEAGMLQRLWWGAAHAFDTRFLDSPWEVPNVPPFSRRNPTWVPSRTQFICWRGAVFVVNLLLLDFLTRPKASPGLDLSAMFADDRIGFFSRLGEVNLDEIVVRFASSGMFYFVVYLFFQTCHCGMSIAIVGLGLSETKMWRPFIGRLGDAWSVRQFWGCFWHQSLRQMFSCPARFLTYDVLGLRKGGFLGRYMFIFLTFWISGVMHLSGELATGLPWHESGVVRFFITQTLGILIEDHVQAAYRAIAGGARDSKANPKLWECVIGYVWVASWISWSLPVNSYPVTRKDEGLGMLPFSIVGKFF